MSDTTVQYASLCTPWTDPDAIRGETDCQPCQGVTDTVPDDDVLETAALSASEYLFAVSGFQFGGVCEATIRPCGNEEGWGWGGLWAWTQIPFVLPNGVWPAWGWGCPGCGTSGCDCCGPMAFALGAIPVVEVSEVKLDGDVLTPDVDYKLVDNLLVRLSEDGRGIAWPFACQDIASDDDLPGTMSVTFTWGADPPALGALAARDLACQLVQQACGGDCGKPSERMTQKVAGGTTIQLLSPDGDIASVMPNSVKLFLKAYGPGIEGERRFPKLRRPNPGNGFIATYPTTDYGFARAGWGSGCC